MQREVPGMLALWCVRVSSKHLRAAMVDLPFLTSHHGSSQPILYQSFILLINAQEILRFGGWSPMEDKR